MATIQGKEPKQNLQRCTCHYKTILGVPFSLSHDSPLNNAIMDDGNAWSQFNLFFFFQVHLYRGGCL